MGNMYKSILRAAPKSTVFQIVEDVNRPYDLRGQIYGGFIGDKLYVAHTLSSITYLHVFDTITNSWQQLPSNPDKSSWPTVVCDGTNLYWIGRVSNEMRLWRYEPSANWWYRLASIPSAYEYSDLYASITFNSRYLYCSSGGSAAMVRYDKINNSWSKLANKPDNRRLHSSALIDGKIYHFFGYTASLMDGLHIYDIASNSWSLKTRLLPLELRYTPIVSVIDGKIYGVGGVGKDSSRLDDMFSYDPSSDTWSSSPWGHGPVSNSLVAYHTDSGRFYMLGTYPEYIFAYAKI